MSRRLALTLSTVFGIMIGYFATTLIADSNIIQRTELFSNDPDNNAALFGGLVIFPSLSIMSGVLLWRAFNYSSG